MKKCNTILETWKLLGKRNSFCINKFCFYSQFRNHLAASIAPWWELITNSFSVCWNLRQIRCHDFSSSHISFLFPEKKKISVAKTVIAWWFECISFLLIAVRRDWSLDFTLKFHLVAPIFPFAVVSLTMSGVGWEWESLPRANLTDNLFSISHPTAHFMPLL